MKFLYFGDRHYSASKLPPNRVDDFLETTKNKDLEIIELAKKENVAAYLQPGDFFNEKDVNGENDFLAEIIDRWNMPSASSLLSKYFSSKNKEDIIDNVTSNIPMIGIAGNHDLWWIRQCGADICKDISNNREDLVYLGSDCENMKIGKLNIRLFHGTGGNAYAKSYKLQKYLDSIDAEERPHILQTGHIHQAFYMKQGNTHCFQTSCLQDLTPYARSKGLSNDKSVWWIDVYNDDKGNPVKIQQELETFGKKLIRKR